MARGTQGAVLGRRLLNSVVKVESGRGRGSRQPEEGLRLGLGPVGLECGDRQRWEEGVEG